MTLNFLQKNIVKENDFWKRANKRKQKTPLYCSGVSFYMKDKQLLCGRKTMLCFAQMKLRQAANDVLRTDVMLRINEVALRANGELQFCCTLTQKSL
jgi:hypothetical protein